MIEKNGGCDHMTCSLCNHDFCWLCLGRWSGGCRNSLCPLTKYLDKRLGCASPFLTPPIKLIGFPTVAVLGVAGGVCAAAILIVGGTLFVPYAGVRLALRRRREKIRLAAAALTFDNVGNRGVGITFVGASASFRDHVQGLPGRTVMPPGTEVCQGEVQDGSTRVIYAGDRLLNVVCRSSESWSYPTVAAFGGDRCRGSDESGDSGERDERGERGDERRGAEHMIDAPTSEDKPHVGENRPFEWSGGGHFIRWRRTINHTQRLVHTLSSSSSYAFSNTCSSSSSSCRCLKCSSATTSLALTRSRATWELGDPAPRPSAGTTSRAIPPP